MALTAKGFPYPVSGDGRPHIDQSIAALAARVDAILSTLSDAEIGLLSLGPDLFDGRYLLQSNVGAVRKWRGLYEWDGSAWRSLIAMGAQASFTPVLTATTTAPNMGTTSSVRGAYVVMGGLCIGRGAIQQGGTGSNVGAGTWLMSLPVAAAYATNRQAVGKGLWYRASAPYSSAIFHGTLKLDDATHVRLTGTNGSSDLGSGTVPFNGVGGLGELNYKFAYRVAA